MPEAEEVDMQINPADIQMDVFRSTGSGGQSVNTTDSAVRLTHKPTGVIVKCQQEKSQLKNRGEALRMLRTKLYEMEMEKQRARGTRLARVRSAPAIAARRSAPTTFHRTGSRITASV